MKKKKKKHFFFYWFCYKKISPEELFQVGQITPDEFFNF